MTTRPPFCFRLTFCRPYGAWRNLKTIYPGRRSVTRFALGYYLLWRHFADDTEAGVAAAERRMDGITLAAAGKRPVMIPIAAPHHFVFAAVGPTRVGLRSCRRWAEPVGAPLPDVPVHV